MSNNVKTTIQENFWILQKHKILVSKIFDIIKFTGKCQSAKTIWVKMEILKTLVGMISKWFCDLYAVLTADTEQYIIRISSRIYFRWNPFVHRCKWPPEARPSDLYPLPDSGAGKGVPHESLPHEATTYWNGPPIMPHGATD